MAQWSDPVSKMSSSLCLPALNATRQCHDQKLQLHDDKVHDLCVAGPSPVPQRKKNKQLAETLPSSGRNASGLMHGALG